MESTHQIPQKIHTPPPPEVTQEYRKEFPFLGLILSPPQEFSDRIAKRHNELVIKINEKNNQRTKKVDLLQDLKEQNEFLAYLHKQFMKIMTSKTGMFKLDKFEINRSRSNGYISDYEDLLYGALSNKFTIIRQASIFGYLVDMVIFDYEKRSVWVIEVDGGIHQYEKIYSKDKEMNEMLSRNGVSVIRIPNNLIKNGISNTIIKIIDEINNP